MFKEIAKKIGILSSNPMEGNSLIISSEELERRVALIENGSLQQYYVEREGNEHIIGSIFKGKIKNIEPSLKAMFIDIGLEKNAFLHFWDAVPQSLEALSHLKEIPPHISKKIKNKSVNARDVPEIYPVGREIIIQISKIPLGNKGPRVTTNISFPGRYLVLDPNSNQFGLSQKISQPKERERLKKICRKLYLPKDVGIIVRTAAQGQKLSTLKKDLQILLEEWEDIQEKAKSQSAPSLIFSEPKLIERSVRDWIGSVDRIICENQEIQTEVNSFLENLPKRNKPKIHLHSSEKSIFEAVNIQKQIETIFKREVPLDCGGYIILDQTEALIAVDVNTGKNKSEKNIEKTILNTNIEAVNEVARQLKLRNMGGIIVIDLIDMRSRRDRDKVHSIMQDTLEKDRAKTQVLPISSLGLMQITRQRLSESIDGSTYGSCSYCQGQGRVKTAMTMSIEIQRELKTFVNQNEIPRDLLIVINLDVLNRLKSEDSNLIMNIERNHKGRITFRSDSEIHREQFKFFDASTLELLFEKN